MPFDEDPQDEIESYPCDCSGTITFNAQDGIWECDSCTFTSNGTDNGAVSTDG